MDIELLNSLNSHAESEFMDRKRQWHDSNVELLHDIICLANSYTNSKRYLLIGIDDAGVKFGVSGDPNRKNNANIQDLLRQSNFNRILDVKLHTLTELGLEFDAVEIDNRPDKPFYLTKDKKRNENAIRAGVIYTRLGDTNVPLRESAPEDKIELMWRERFGIGQSTLQRLEKLLDSAEDWEKTSGDEEIHHKMFPEFTIIDGRELNSRYSEPWTAKFPDKDASSIHVEMRYFGTVLKRVGFVFCDGYRYRVPIPKYDAVSRSYVIERKDIGYKLAIIYDQYSLESVGVTFDDILLGVGLELR